MDINEMLDKFINILEDAIEDDIKDIQSNISRYCQILQCFTKSHIKNNISKQYHIMFNHNEYLRDTVGDPFGEPFSYDTNKMFIRYSDRLDVNRDLNDYLSEKGYRFYDEDSNECAYLQILADPEPIEKMIQHFRNMLNEGVKWYSDNKIVHTMYLRNELFDDIVKQFENRLAQISVQLGQTKTYMYLEGERVIWNENMREVCKTMLRKLRHIRYSILLSLNADVADVPVIMLKYSDTPHPRLINEEYLRSRIYYLYDLVKDGHIQIVERDGEYVYEYDSSILVFNGIEIYGKDVQRVYDYMLDNMYVKSIIRIVDNYRELADRIDL